jgi:hypothetical protein
VPKFHAKKSCFYLFDIDDYFSDHHCRQALMLKKISIFFNGIFKQVKRNVKNEEICLGMDFRR